MTDERFPGASYDVWLEEPYLEMQEPDYEPRECEECGDEFDINYAVGSNDDPDRRYCTPCGRDIEDENHAEACAVEAWKGDDEEW